MALHTQKILATCNPVVGDACNLPCFYPLQGWRAKAQNYVINPDHTSTRNGKYSIVFDISLGYADMPMSVPCGNCDGCHLARASDWAVRATHENGCHDEAIFLTLTYHDDYLPDPPFVSVSVMQKFIKRLRKKVGTVRYLLCGEYGSKTMRPHYHILIFGWRPPDATFQVDRPTGRVFTSELIFKLWPYGLHEFGSVTPASAGYTARYTTKKIFASHEVGHEFLLSSRRPPLGIPWLEKHYKEFYPLDAVTLAGKKYKPPTAYDRWLEANHPELHKEVLNARFVRSTEPETIENNTIRRLTIREGVLLDRIKGLHRGN